MAHSQAQAPVANFTASVTNGCGPLVVSFKDQSTNSPQFWQWDFGNNQTSSSQNPSCTYSAPGTYTVTLIVRNSSGTDAIQKTGYITVLPFPTPIITANLTTACAPAAIQFTDKSTPGQGSITAWSWDLGDGSSSNQQNPAHSYAQPGFYTVKLQVTNSGGCSNSVTANRYIRVVEGIKPHFNWDQISTSCSAPFVVNFLDQTAGPGTLTYDWDLGNGSTSTDPNPANVSYPANTTYTVKLAVQSSLGCSANFDTTVTFTGGTPLITAPAAACTNAPVTFTNGSTPTPVSNTWDFGDGTNSTITNPSKTYTTAGTYTVTLSNKYSSCANSTTRTIQIIDKPNPAFTADKTSACQPNLAVQFTDNTPDPGITQWLWDFGDGQTSTQQNPPHTYTRTGSFDVKLTVTNATGCSNTITMPGYIKVQGPTVNIDPGSLSGCTNTPISPIALVGAIDGVASYNWSAPGATPSSSTAANPTFTYATQNNYTISLTITTNGGCTASNSFNVQVGDPTAADFTAVPPNACGTNPVTFTSPSTPVDSWFWNFGDGSTSTAAPPLTHSFHSVANKNVTLTVTHFGCPQSITKTVHVDPPIAKFGFTPDCPFNNLTAIFHDSSMVYNIFPAKYVWDFGDGTQQTDNLSIGFSPYVAPSHPYAAPGTYTVTLTLTNGSCTDVPYQLTITVGQVTPSFDISKNPICKNETFTLTSTSTTAPSNLQIIGYSWIVDSKPYVSGGTTYSDTISTAGTHNLTLFLTDQNQCVYQVIKPITVIGPTAKFNAIGNCKGTPVVFTDGSTPDPNSPGGSITGWSWNFGDGGTSNVQNPTHPYTDTTSYNVKLTVTDNTTCTDTYTAPIRVTSPMAFFSTDTLYCPNIAMPFKDSSQGHGLTYSWNFGDGNTSNVQNPTNTYTATGRYDVSLTVTDLVGCQNTLTLPKYVHIQPPIPAFTLADSTSICPPMEANFTAQGQYYDSLYWDFGDGTTSTLPVTSHFYNDYGPNDYQPGLKGYYNAQLVLRGPGGCLASTSRKVYVFNPFTAYYYYGPPTKACDSVPVTFTLNPPPYTKFTLVFGDGAADSSGNLSPFHMYRNPGTYTTQEIMVDPTGCVVGIGGGNGDITVLGATPFFDMDKKKFCDNGIVNFSGISISNDGFTSIGLNFGDGTNKTEPGLVFSDQHSYTQPGTYIPTLQISTTSGCTETYKDTVKIYQTPHPLISTTGSLCTGIIQFAGDLVTPDPDTVFWAWSFSNGKTSKDQNPSLTLPPGIITAHLKTSIPFGCSDTISKNVTIFPLPDIKGPKEITTPVGFAVTLPFTYSPNVSTWTWAPVTDLDCPTCANPSANPTFSTEYRVTVTDENGCVNTDSILVKTLCNDKNYFLPNTFSPNGDGVNDRFYPRGSNLYNIQSIRIFNRWGQIVFERKNFPANSDSDGWDGTINGHPAPPDVYLYIVEVICNNAQVVALHGDVTLIR